MDIVKCNSPDMAGKFSLFGKRRYLYIEFINVIRIACENFYNCTPCCLQCQKARIQSIITQIRNFHRRFLANNKIVLFKVSLVGYQPVKDDTQPKNNNILYNGQDINKAGDFKDIVDGLVDVSDVHFALLVHGLLGLQQDTQTCGGYVLQSGKVQNQLFDAGEALIQFYLQLGSGGGIQSAGDGNVQFGSVQILYYSHNNTSFLICKYLFIKNYLQDAETAKACCSAK
jgi:hypothetical protein